MWAWIRGRVLATMPVVVIVALVVFSILHGAPRDPAAVIAGDQATSERIEEMRAKSDRDRPLHEQFRACVGAVPRGDFGTSIFSRRPVTQLFMQRLEPTLALATTTIVITVLLAVPIGVPAAWKAGPWVDRVVMAFAVAGVGFAVFVVAPIRISVFSTAALHRQDAELDAPARCRARHLDAVRADTPAALAASTTRQLASRTLRSGVSGVATTASHPGPG